MWFGYRLSWVTVALILFVPVLFSSPSVIASPAPPAWVEPGLLHGESGQAGSGVDATTGVTPGSDRVSLIVRLDGPTVGTIGEVHAMHGRQVADSGGTDVSHATLQALHDAIERGQEPAAAAVTALGASVIDRYQNVMNGMLVHATRDQVAAIARVPGVTSVAYAPLLEPAVVDSVPHIGAPRVWGDLGYQGRGSLVAILDTGVDYTHAAFDGAGDPEAYTRNNENLVESGTFPTRRVVGGYDFAGMLYTASIQCGPHPGQECDPTPRPDDDPIDSRGHGTHVAGIIAGQAAGDLSSGVAPAAKLVPIKIFGNPVNAPVVTDLLSSAFEWVADNNLELDVPGFATERIDIINISVTGSWKTGWYETELIVKEAADRGLTIIVAAGNEGPYGYIGGPAAGAEEVVSVGSTYAPGERGLLAEATWSGDQSLDTLALDSWIYGQPETAQLGGFQGQLAWMGTACNDVPPEQDVAGKVALIARGVCGFPDKLTNAQNAGATAGIIFTTPELRVVHMGGAAELTIPAVMIDYVSGRRLVDALESGEAVNVRVYEPANDLLADTISGFSNRGPARLTAVLKPQLVAPGSFIRSAWPGTGDSGRAQSGTSMAAAHVAGVAALLSERNREEDLGLDSNDIGAMAMNYAVPTVKFERQDEGRLVPVALQGAGRLDAFGSAKGNTVVRSEFGIAELSFGHISVKDEVATVNRQLRVRNLSDAPKTYQTAVELLYPEEDVDHGVTVSTSMPTLTVSPGGTVNLEVTMTVDPAGLRPWALSEAEAVLDTAGLGQAEVDGYVRLTEVDGSGQPVPDGDAVNVPFHSLPRRHSCVESVTQAPFVISSDGGRVSQRWINPCQEPGPVRLYPLVATDPTENELPGGVDIQSIGMRYGPVDADDPESEIFLEWMITTREARRMPRGTQFRIYIDLNQDGEFDWIVFTMYGPDLDLWIGQGLPFGRWVDAHALVAPDSLEPDYLLTEGNLFFHGYDVDETTTRVFVTADELDLDMRTGGERFDYAVVVVDDKGDYPLVGGERAQDVSPDGFIGGEVHVFDQWLHDCIGPQVNRVVPAGGEVTVELNAKCPGPAAGETQPVPMLMTYPANLPGSDQSQLRDGTLGGGRALIYLPSVKRDR